MNLWGVLSTVYQVLEGSPEVADSLRRASEVAETVTAAAKANYSAAEARGSVDRSEGLVEFILWSSKLRT